MLASIAHSVPPRSYGPWEQVASTLTEGLVERGHDVTLFATANSVTTADLHAEAPAGYEEDDAVDAKVYEALHIASVFERANDFDIISNQFDFLPLAFSGLVAHSRRHHDPWLLVRADRSRVPQVRRDRPLRRDQRRGPAP